MSLKNNILGKTEHKDKIKTKWLKTNSPIEIIINDGKTPLSNFTVKEKAILNKLNIIADQDIILKTGKQINKEISLSKFNNIDWSKIIGYDDIKTVISSVLSTNSNKKTHLLIAGSAGTSKTVFLKVIEANLKLQNKNVHYLDSTTLSSSGVIEYLFTNDVEYLCLDEIDKLEKTHQGTFLNLLESGILQETKHKRIRKKEYPNLVTIATANYLEKLMHPLLTRFLVLEIPKYTKDQFFKISISLLTQQYNKTVEIAEYITKRIWEIYTVKRKTDPNMRQCVQVASISGNDKKQIDVIINALEKYSKMYE